MQTKRQIRKLIRQADLVLVNGFQYQVASYNLNEGEGVAIKLKGEGLQPRSFSMEELQQAERLDTTTLRVSELRHHVAFIKLKRITIDGSD